MRKVIGIIQMSVMMSNKIIDVLFKVNGLCSIARAYLIFSSKDSTNRGENISKIPNL